jgi:hypothetical protein
MRRREDELIDPEVVAALDAIDATLAGEPVDPRHAELAELALLLAAQRPEIAPEAGRALDDRVARRFARAPAPPAAAEAGRRRRARWLTGPLAGLAVAVFAVAVIVGVGLAPGGGKPSGAVSSSAAGSGAGTVAVSSAAPAVAHAGAAGQPRREPSAPAAASGAAAAPNGAQSAAKSAPAVGPNESAGSSSSTGSSSASSAAGAASGAPGPVPNGRRITQSAQLTLTTAPAHIDDVAQEVFNVVGAQNGIVKSSTVTAAAVPYGYADFELSIPSGNLQQTMTQLSQLRYATVGSRTDTTQDVNNQYVSAQNALADAQALRTSLLKQLEVAYTQTQIDSLNAQLHDAEAAIASAQAQLRSLNQQINYSQVSVTINSATPPVAPAKGDGGFTIRKATHDAGRVLTIALGVALIGLAALVPIGLAVALAWWIGAALRRRQREHALDIA